MNSLCQDVLPTSAQLSELNLDNNTGASIISENLSNDTNLPICYLFKNFWIELITVDDKYYQPTTIKNKVWQVLIHSSSENKTVIALGSYSSLLEAVLKTEQVISKWK